MPRMFVGTAKSISESKLSRLRASSISFTLDLSGPMCLLGNSLFSIILGTSN